MARRDSLEQTEVSPWSRYPVILINLAILIIAMVFVGMCVYSIYLRWDDVSLARGSLFVSLVVNIDVALLVGVAFLGFVSSLGFVGALRENMGCLLCYNWMLFITVFTCSLSFVLLIVAPFLATRHLQSVVSIELIERYRDNADYQQIVDFIQEQYKCCGVTEAAYLDWNSNIYYNCSKSNPSTERCSVPPSCCREPNKESVETLLQRRFCGHSVLAMSEEEAWEKVHTRNCVNSFAKTVQQKSVMLCVAAVVVVCVLLLVKSMALRVLGEIAEIAREYNRHQRKLQYRERVRQAYMRARASPRDTPPRMPPQPQYVTPGPYVTPPYVPHPVQVYYVMQDYPLHYLQQIRSTQ